MEAYATEQLDNCVTLWSQIWNKKQHEGDWLAKDGVWFKISIQFEFIFLFLYV